MSNLKAADKAYILVGDVGSFGERAYKVHILSIENGWKCQLMCVDEQNNPTGESFMGVLSTLYATKNEAIEEMIKRLNELREEQQ